MASVINEKRILDMIEHPFCCALASVYSDPDPHGSIHLLIDACLGGELYGLIREASTLELSTARHYGACVILALTHLHEQNIAYRDLKPENIVIDASGWIQCAPAPHLALPSAPPLRLYPFGFYPRSLAPSLRPPLPGPSAHPHYSPPLPAFLLFTRCASPLLTLALPFLPHVQAHRLWLRQGTTHRRQDLYPLRHASVPRAGDRHERRAWPLSRLVGVRGAHVRDASRTHAV